MFFGGRRLGWMVPWYQVYECNCGEGWRLGVSASPDLDKEYYREHGGVWGFRVLSEPLPLGQAYNRFPRLRGLAPLLHKIRFQEPKQDMSDSWYKEDSQNSQDGWVSVAGRCGQVGQGSQVSQGSQAGQAGGVSPSYFPVSKLAICVGQLLAGRILLWEEVLAVVLQAATRGIAGMEMLTACPQALLEVLQLLVLWNQAAVMPAVDGGCNRCGNPEPKWVPCEACSPKGTTCTGCFLCEECISMGASRSCTPLWRFGPPGCRPAPRSVELCLDFVFTPAQREAANRVLKQVTAPGNVLVVAACGAGKTEITFPAIARTLERGGRVLFAIPRRDVVRDLEPRLKKAFPRVKCIALYGGSTERFAAADLVLATTHQVLRYYRSFDLVILDEVDAYPYADSAMLHRGVERAVGYNGNLILMTATPTPELLQLVAQGNLVQVNLPARHHGYPLPVPEVVVDRHLADRAGEIRLSDRVLALIRWSLEMGHRLFVFVPAIRMAGEVADYLQGCLGNQYLIRAVHSRTSGRDELITAFKEGRLNILVTTTVLERGVTVPNSDVLVVAAHLEKVFDSGALIQMAGRAGRVSAFPTGKVWFVGAEDTPAMRQAIANIVELNTQAAQSGFLKCGI